MQFIMTISDVFCDPNRGVIVVGANPEITKNDTTKLCRIGERVIIKGANKEVSLKVINIDLSFSMSEKLIISIQLDGSTEISKLNAGDLLYKD